MKEKEALFQKKVIYSCKEHAEYALEEMINDTEASPSLELFQGEKQLTIPCEYCGQPSIYMVSNEYSPTKCG